MLHIIISVKDHVSLGAPTFFGARAACRMTRPELRNTFRASRERVEIPATKAATKEFRAPSRSLWTFCESRAKIFHRILISRVYLWSAERMLPHYIRELILLRVAVWPVKSKGESGREGKKERLRPRQISRTIWDGLRSRRQLLSDVIKPSRVFFSGPRDSHSRARRNIPASFCPLFHQWFHFSQM